MKVESVSLLVVLLNQEKLDFESAGLHAVESYLGHRNTIFAMSYGKSSVHLLRAEKLLL